LDAGVKGNCRRISGGVACGEWQNVKREPLKFNYTRDNLRALRRATHTGAPAFLHLRQRQLQLPKSAGQGLRACNWPSDVPERLRASPVNDLSRCQVSFSI